MTAEIQRREEGDRLIIHVEGEVDLDVAPRLWREIEKALRKSSNVGVELCDVVYIDSSGVAALVQGLKEARHRHARFALLEPSQRVRAVLELAQLDQVFNIETEPSRGPTDGEIV